MAVTKIKPVKSTLSKALDYIENPDKTDGKMLISSFGCSYETADIEFGYTLSQALDKGNNLAFHLIQSFAPGEVDYEKAHETCKVWVKPMPLSRTLLPKPPPSVRLPRAHFPGLSQRPRDSRRVAERSRSA